MEETFVEVNLLDFPMELSYYVAVGDVYDCSCRSDATTYHILGEEEEYYLKCAPKDSLKREALMTHWFYEQGLAEDIEVYVSYDKDYMVKRSVKGIDLTDPSVLAEPEKLCQLYASVLKKIHSLDPSTLPQDPVCQEFVNDGYTSDKLAKDTVIHGDYCLPNVIIKDGEFQGVIDVGQACLGDRHVDLYWALWSMEYNLKTDAYRDVFLEAYGKDLVKEELLEVIRLEEEGLQKEEANE